MYRVEGCLLETEYGAITFATPVRQVIEVKGVLIVRLGLMGREDDINNVYGVQNGQIKWRIQDKRLYNPNYADPLLPQWDPYVLCRPFEDDKTLFLGTTFHGECFRIDSRTGLIVGYEGWFR